MSPRNRIPRTRDRGPAGPWKHGPIPVIGLIGGIGGGKSLAAEILARRGAFVLDADAVGHALLDQRPVREQVVERFGPGVLAGPESPEGAPRVDRKALGGIVFAQPQARRDLEAIVHPLMRRTFARAISREVRRGRARGIVLDAAILLEAGWNDLCDRVVFIDAPRDRRLARLAASRGWDESALSARERAQWPLDRKREAADAVVLNDAGPEELDAKLARLWDELAPPPSDRRAGGPAGARPATRRPRPATPPHAGRDPEPEPATRMEDGPSESPESLER